MKNKSTRFNQGSVLVISLLASVVLLVITLTGYFATEAFLGQL